MKGVRFTKAERAALVSAIEHANLTSHGSKSLEAALAKLEAAELPVKKPTHGVTVTDAIGAFREVLGARLVAPPFSAVGVLAQMKNRLGALGLTRGDCITIAKVAAAEWRGPVKAESLCRQADTLLAMSQQGLNLGELVAKAKAVASFVELDDDEI